jgi:hypothetical protein
VAYAGGAALGGEIAAPGVTADGGDRDAHDDEAKGVVEQTGSSKALYVAVLVSLNGFVVVSTLPSES